MQICRFAVSDRESWGFVLENGVVDAAASGVTFQDAIGLEPGALANLRSSLDVELLPLDELSLRAPAQLPSKFIGVGLNYRDHAAESNMDLPDEPVLFGLFPSAITDPGAPILLPSHSEDIDWEAELGIVIGRRARDVAREDALDVVAGYTIVNDVSARDLQMADGQWSRAKSFDTFKPIGPWLTTRDELGDASGLGIRLWVNDTLMQSSTTAELIFDVRYIVAYLSSWSTLEPGDVITTGTPAGVGFGRTPPEYLRDGDVVTIEIDGIGNLTNPVAKAPVTASVPAGPHR